MTLNVGNVERLPVSSQANLPSLHAQTPSAKDTTLVTA
jgi:hypothetical protein